MPAARHHHYIPRWYLSGFTDTGTADGFITVHDIIEERDFRTRTQGVGAVRDFNRVEIDGIDPDAFERALSSFETDASQAFDRIIDSGRIQDREDLIYLINTVALLAIHNPTMRNQMNDIQDRIMRMISQNAISSQSRYEKLITAMRSDGIEIPNGVTYEQVRDFIERDEYSINIPRESNIQNEMELLDPIINELVNRNWSLYTPENPNSHFVSCDNPVVLSWRNPEMRGPIGYGLTNTEVTFPVSKRYMIIGTFEDDLETFYRVPDTIVAFANTQRRSNAQRHVYSSNNSYLYAT